ncbi:MAG: M23 family metallopeptidase [Cyanobacteria bacterium]|nr:M23 family metallopeptidase [Cyanobacteriota bacterium]MDA0866975.1 M23 family metallopeptidase [Cyanobacteriota bacterium]
MGSETFSSRATLGSIFFPKVLQALAVAGGLGILSGGLVMPPPAIATDEDSPAAEVVPVETSAESLLTPQPSSTITAPEPAAPAPAQPAIQPAPVSESGPQVEVLTRPTAPGNYNNVFIDSTNYELGATPSPDSPTVIFSDRSGGCRFTATQGAAPQQNCSAAPGGSGNATASATNSGGFSVGPVTVGIDGVTVGNTTIISREAINQTLRPINLLRRGAEEFVFPLATPAPISSLFGWRTHPIFGGQRLHTGTDLAAPTGTPVLAAKDGTVTTADYLGGYGLTVILHHEQGTEETRYAHLSQLMVRPGETVKQGDVVGLVGSTGNSTGPHLHFEVRQLTAQGWVLVNPNELLQQTVANFVDVLNQPLQALGVVPNAEPGDAAADGTVPYRPAQPNAS